MSLQPATRYTDVPGTFVVQLGGAADLGGSPAGLSADRHDVALWLREAAEARRLAEDARRASAEAELVEATGRLQAAEAARAAHAADTAQRQARCERWSSETAALKDAYATRREALLAMAERARELAAAAEAWTKVDDRRLESEAALVALWERSAPGGVSEALQAVIADMASAQTMLARTDRRCASVVTSAVERVVEARRAAERSNEALQLLTDAWWDGESEMSGLPLVSLVRFVELAAGASETDGEGLDAERAAAEAAREAASTRLDELATSPMPGPSASNVILSGLRALLAAADDGPVVVTDLLADQDQGTVSDVLVALPDVLSGRRFAYVTADPRVLSWALLLPAEIGGVVGVGGPGGADPAGDPTSALDATGSHPRQEH